MDGGKSVSVSGATRSLHEILLVLNFFIPATAIRRATAPLPTHILQAVPALQRLPQLTDNATLPLANCQSLNALLFVFTCVLDLLHQTPSLFWLAIMRYLVSECSAEQVLLNFYFRPLPVLIVVVV